MKRIKMFALALFISLPVVPALAHHSFAMFDQTKTTELTDVTVVRFAWANPHVFLVVRSGTTTYTLEASSPALMQRSGWRFNTVKVGSKIDVAFNPLRNGQPGGSLTRAKLPDGSELVAG